MHEALNGLLTHVFGEVVWVEGELTDISRSKAGHVYFRLVDPDDERGDANRASLSVTLFDSQRQLVNRFLRSQGDPIRMNDGIRVRIGGRLATYPARSTLQLVMDRIDPAFTLGLLGQERVRLLAALDEEGLLRQNAAVAVPVVPLHVGLVTSVGSAAHADALHELESSGVGFRVSTFDARTQGADAPASVVAALRTAAAHRVDVVLIVRGGGAATDLVAFDHEQVARAIAGAPVAVFTGIGHETDRTVADEVAHTAHKTPTAAAGALVRAVRDAERRVVDDWAAVRAGVAGRLVRAEHRLARVGHRAGATAVHRLDRRMDALDRDVQRVTAGARRRLAVAEAAVAAVGTRAEPSAARIVERASSRLDVLAANVAAADPARALRRGWSVTHTADGRLVRSPADVVAGDELVTRVAGGAVRSVVVDGDRSGAAAGRDREGGSSGG
ncbi:exodeoxyribonuclease VII large subunit [Dermatobacter hominis]|nr:exodeoxyribonuclease VII large subunit [Dermatobacter hominis]